MNIYCQHTAMCSKVATTHTTFRYRLAPSGRLHGPDVISECDEHAGCFVGSDERIEVVSVRITLNEV